MARQAEIRAVLARMASVVEVRGGVQTGLARLLGHQCSIRASQAVAAGLFRYTGGWAAAAQNVGVKDGQVRSPTRKQPASYSKLENPP